MSLAQIGEFSYIIAQIGVNQGNVNPFLYDITVALSVVTVFTTPWLIRFSDPFAKFLDSRLPKPLQTFIALYGSWLEGLRQGTAEENLTRRARKLAGFLIVDTFCLIAIIITTTASIKKWIPQFQQSFHFGALNWHILLITGGVIIALPFLAGVLKSAKILGGLIAFSAIPLKAQGALDLGLAPRQVLTVTLQIGILFAIGFPLLAVTQPFLPFGYSPALFAVALAILGGFFWKNAVNLHEHVQAGAQMLTQALSHHVTESQEVLMGQVSQMVPGIGAPQSVPIGAESPAIGKTLGELNIRSQTGASVIAIMRNQERFLMPSGKESVQAGDILVLVGTFQAIRQGKELLQKHVSMGKKPPKTQPAT
jgi:CPA2 family monovalent cation:H+ antiporter-2